MLTPHCQSLDATGKISLMKIVDLPADVERLLCERKASPRLVAHLTLVHAVACQLLEKVEKSFPTLKFDRSAVIIGAATHDIGKVIHPNELTEHGNQHEAAGQELLLKAGFSAKHARFALTHGGQSCGELTVEDFLVRTADTVWKGKRAHHSEMDLVRCIAQKLNLAEWQVYSTIDEILTDIASGADVRLQWQFEHPVEQ